MKEWLGSAFERTVVRRALYCALIVGAVLIAINHGDAIIRLDVTPSRLARMALTLLVPYCVSTYSSVSALRALRRADPHPSK